ncbi:MAG: YqgE/AlgH family protein [Vicinamibacteria bacterium]|nr:YqgE/AlgH family protein [Vicinamibacteria bacterium]
MEDLRAPYLLIAAPSLRDPNFEHSVVLMGRHTSEGAVGWIVNRVLEKRAVELLAEPFARAVHPLTPLHLGGPVSTDGLLVLFHGAVEGVAVEFQELAQGLRLSTTPAILSEVFREPPTRGPRGLLIHGYAGWGPGQLEREMEEGAWLVAPYEEELTFSPTVDGCWERGLALLGITPGALGLGPTRAN